MFVVYNVVGTTEELVVSFCGYDIICTVPNFYSFLLDIEYIANSQILDNTLSKSLPQFLS